MARKKTKAFLILIIILFVLLGSGYFAMKSISFFDIKSCKVEVSGPVSEPTDEVMRIIQPCRGKNIFEISLADLKGRLSSCFGVSEAEITRFYPDKIIFRVEYKDFPAKIESEGKYYFADESSMYEVQKQIFDAFSEVRAVEIDSAYCAFLTKWGFDEGFYRASQLVGSLKSNLITLIKYDNNNGNDFGRLILTLDAMGVQLYVCEAVSADRIEQAIELLREEISIPENGTRYDLYSDSLIKRS